MRLLLQNDVKTTAQALKNTQEALGVNFPAKFTKPLKFAMSNLAPKAIT